MELPKINVYLLDGTVESSYLVSELISNWREEFYYSDAVFQTVISEESSRRLARPHTKTKGEVSGGGKKPYRQKHTGRARQGSRRNPQFVGGGTAFGPRKNVNHYKKVNKRVRALAIRSCWSEALSSQKVIGLSEKELANFPANKTKTIASFFSLINFSIKRENSRPKNILLLVKEKGSKLELGARNLPNLHILRVNSLSIKALMAADLILLSADALLTLREDYFNKWA